MTTCNTIGNTITVSIGEFCARLEAARRYRHRAFMGGYLTKDDRRVIAQWTGNAGGHYLQLNNASATKHKRAVGECTCQGEWHRAGCPHRIV